MAGLYVLRKLAAGERCLQRSKNIGDFFLGGRTLGAWMSAFVCGIKYLPVGAKAFSASEARVTS